MAKGYNELQRKQCKCKCYAKNEIEYENNLLFCKQPFNKYPMNLEIIHNKIFEVRNQKVMLDFDLVPTTKWHNNNSEVNEFWLNTAVGSAFFSLNGLSALSKKLTINSNKGWSFLK